MDNNLLSSRNYYHVLRKDSPAVLIELGPRSVLAVLRNEDVRSMPEAYFMAGVV
jgi:hypothetical protein